MNQQCKSRSLIDGRGGVPSLLVVAITAAKLTWRVAANGRAVGGHWRGRSFTVSVDIGRTRPVRVIPCGRSRRRCGVRGGESMGQSGGRERGLRGREHSLGAFFMMASLITSTIASYCSKGMLDTTARPASAGVHTWAVFLNARQTLGKSRCCSFGQSVYK